MLMSLLRFTHADYLFFFSFFLSVITVYKINAIRGAICSSCLWTLDCLLQLWYLSRNIHFPKTVDLLCFLFRVAVFIHLKSPFAARFKLCKLSF